MIAWFTSLNKEKEFHNVILVLDYETDIPCKTLPLLVVTTGTTTLNECTELNLQFTF